MSDIVKDERPKSDLQEKNELVDNIERRKALESALFHISKNNTFYGAVLQSLDIFYSDQIPTAGVMYDPNARKWIMHLNPYFFARKLSTLEMRVAVLLHEFFHITHKHPFRAPFLKVNPERRMTMNVAMDVAINQFIKDLPNGCDECKDIDPSQQQGPCSNELCPGKCMSIERFYDPRQDGKDKKAFIDSWTNKTWEFIYEKILEKMEKESEGEPNQEGDGSGEGEGNGNSKKKGSGRTKKLVEEGGHDEHQWDASASETDMMDATEELVRRAMQKVGMRASDAPGFIKDLLQDMDARRAQLNYKQLLLLAIKRHASGQDRKHSWTRKSRRFGSKSPGTKYGDLPKLNNYIDTSGSISVQECNDFLSVIDEFLKVGSRKCNIGLWHTELYSVEPYKVGDRTDGSVQKRVQSGGTDPEPVLRHIYENQPDLSIILTDGCYGDVDVESWMKPGEQFPVVLWVISADGTENHPLTRIGETIRMRSDSAK